MQMVKNINWKSKTALPVIQKISMVWIDSVQEKFSLPYLGYEKSFEPDFKRKSSRIFP